MEIRLQPVDKTSITLAAQRRLVTVTLVDVGGSGSWGSNCGTDGGDNIDSDPFYVDDANDNYELDYLLSCIQHW